MGSCLLEHHFGGLKVVETQTSYECVACGMTKTVAADQKAPSCCGKEMQKTAAPKPGESKGKEGSCQCCAHLGRVKTPRKSGVSVFH